MRRLMGCVALLGACEALPDDLPDRLTDAPVSTVDAPPVSQVAYGGTYDVSGTWDLSRPFGPDGIGGVVAELMIERIVMLAGVPSALEGEARTLLAGQIREPIVSYVNGIVPTEMLATSPTMVALEDLLDDVQFEASMTFAAGGDPDRFTGGEIVRAIAVQRGEVIHPIRMGELLDGAVTVEADYAGRATGATTLTVEPHALEIRYGQLVALAARDALGVDVVAMAEQAWAQVQCPAIVTSFAGAGGYTITVASQDFTVSNANLVSGCDALKAMAEEYALGMFRRDAGMTLGGPIAVTDGDPVRIGSEAGYGGTITLFPVFTPLVTASFSGAPQGAGR